MDVSGGGEFAAIARLAARLPAAPPGELWIGDDAAVLQAVGSTLLMSTDSVVAGVHADLDLVSLADVGWKAMAVNVSDLAAMGGRPLAAVVAVAGPAETDLDLLYDGIASAAKRWACPVVGGDLVSAPTLVVTVTVIGDGDGDRPPVRRSGAQPSDTLFVTGPLGSSAAGLRLLRAGQSGSEGSDGSHGKDRELVAAHRRPQARLSEGQAARRSGASAMIDVSDGLAADLVHVLDASGVGARVSGIPVADGATIDEALAGGEDYELVFSAPDPAGVERCFAAAGLRLPLVLGVCTEEPTERVLDGEPLVATGWEHPWR